MGRKTGSENRREENRERSSKRERELMEGWRSMYRPGTYGPLGCHVENEVPAKNANRLIMIAKNREGNRRRRQ